MDDDEYVQTPEGMSSARELIQYLSPGTTTSARSIRRKWEQLASDRKRIVQAYFRRKERTATALNTRERRVYNAINA